jgi:co-chaperonin GroES (HSP10)
MINIWFFLAHSLLVNRSLALPSLNGKMGEDRMRLPMDVKAGDRVLFSKHGGTEIKIDGAEHLFMRQDDILDLLE